MKKILMALAVCASVTVASAQTQPAQQKTEAKKECHQAKKECTKEGKGTCCMSTSKAKAISTAKKTSAKKG